ncbi:MAG: CarD family transcriptional regulator, partial [Verrucomicrobiota bacterium]
MADHASLLAALSDAPAFRAALRPHSGRTGRKRRPRPIAFQHVIAEAHSVLAALLASSHAGRTWIICPNSSAQERLFSVLQLWLPNALFFPEAPLPSIEGAIPDPELVAERLSLLSQFGEQPNAGECIVLTRSSLESQVPSPQGLRRTALHFRKGQSIERETALQQLENEGYELVPRVSERGHVAVRGGILDIFGFQHLRPVRLEFFGDEVESIRAFELDSQSSVEALEECTLVGIDAPETGLLPMVRLIGAEDRVVCSDAFAQEDDPELLAFPEADLFFVSSANVSSEETALPENHQTAFYPTGLGPFDVGDFIVDERKREIFFQQLAQWLRDGWPVFLFCRNEGDTERLQEIIPAGLADALVWVQGEIPGGFVCPGAQVAVLCDADLLGRSMRVGRMRHRPVAEALTRGMLDFTELTEGELVVHLEHGIGRFEGLRDIPREGTSEQVLV